MTGASGSADLPNILAVAGRGRNLHVDTPLVPAIPVGMRPQLVMPPLTFGQDLQAYRPFRGGRPTRDQELETLRSQLSLVHQMAEAREHQFRNVVEQYQQTEHVEHHRQMRSVEGHAEDLFRKQAEATAEMQRQAEQTYAHYQADTQRLIATRDREYLAERQHLTDELQAAIGERDRRVSEAANLVAQNNQLQQQLVSLQAQSLEASRASLEANRELRQQLEEMQQSMVHIAQSPRLGLHQPPAPTPLPGRIAPPGVAALPSQVPAVGIVPIAAPQGPLAEPRGPLAAPQGPQTAAATDEPQMVIEPSVAEPQGLQQQTQLNSGTARAAPSPRSLAPAFESHLTQDAHMPDISGTARSAGGEERAVDGESHEGSPSEHSDRSEENRPKSKRKEADHIKIQPFPRTPQFRTWVLQLRNNVASASGALDKAFAWIMKVDSTITDGDEERKIQMNELEDSEEFATLDAKLASALYAIVSGDMAYKITLAQEELARNRKFLKGRQMLWMIFRHFEITEEDGAVLEFQDLMRVEMVGNDIRTFMNRWDTVIVQLKKPPSADILRCTFLQKIEKCPQLRELIAHFNRLERSDPDYSYEYLHRCLRKHLERTQRESNRAALQQNLGKQPALPAPKAGDKAKKGGAHQEKGARTRATKRPYPMVCVVLGTTRASASVAKNAHGHTPIGRRAAAARHHRPAVGAATGGDLNRPAVAKKNKNLGTKRHASSTKRGVAPKVGNVPIGIPGSAMIGGRASVPKRIVRSCIVKKMQQLQSVRQPKRPQVMQAFACTMGRIPCAFTRAAFAKSRPSSIRRRSRLSNRVGPCTTERNFMFVSADVNKNCTLSRPTASDFRSSVQYMRVVLAMSGCFGRSVGRTPGRKQSRQQSTWQKKWACLFPSSLVSRSRKARRARNRDHRRTRRKSPKPRRPILPKRISNVRPRCRKGRKTWKHRAKSPAAAESGERKRVSADPAKGRPVHPVQ